MLFTDVCMLDLRNASSILTRSSKTNLQLQARFTSKTRQTPGIVSRRDLRENGLKFTIHLAYIL